MEKFALRASLKTPAILNMLTLDGLLGAVLFDELQDIDKAHQSIPIHCADGLFYASAVCMVGQVNTGQHGFIAGLRATHDLNLDEIKQGRDGGTHRRIGLTRRSDLGNVLNSYKTVMAPYLEWHACGDPEQVLSLLENVEFLGKRRASGFGQVTGWHLIESKLDGLTDEDDQPLRPIPFERWHGDPNAIRADAAWRPAYWMPEHRAICAVPKGFE